MAQKLLLMGVGGLISGEVRRVTSFPVGQFGLTYLKEREPFYRSGCYGKRKSQRKKHSMKEVRVIGRLGNDDISLSSGVIVAKPKK